jgi:hypothetical protein
VKSAWPAAIALAAPVFLVPASNPDVFWHLSAGRWIIENGAFPREDFLSFTRSGAAWHDFEWLSQIIFYGVHSLAGLGGLWALKVGLLGAGAAILLRGLNPRWLLVWAACMLARSDIRPELFSLILFSLLTTRPLGTGATAGLFALWSNLHAGFLFALPLLWREPRRLAAAIGGSLINPYFWGPYQAALEHAGSVRWISEWQPSSILNLYHWPFFVLLALYAWQWRLRPVAIPYALAALKHGRLSLYFDLQALPALAKKVKLPAWATLPYAAWLVWLLAGISWAGLFDFKFVPARAAGFIEQAPKLNLYNEWEWGGYLSWRIPGHKVFWDGRYLFQRMLDEAAESAKSAEGWQAFLGKYGAQGALLENRAQLFSTMRVYKDGKSREFLRPWYLRYMPREKWALVYFDDKTLFFVDRRAVDKKWLKAHEYKWLRPHDESALADARARKEIPEKEYQAELVRHAGELSL